MERLLGSAEVFFLLGITSIRIFLTVSPDYLDAI